MGEVEGGTGCWTELMRKGEGGRRGDRGRGKGRKMEIVRGREIIKWR